MQITVPFNFQQPVVENAFVHGVEKSVYKKLRIFVGKTERGVELRVVNSGTKLSEQKCKMINQGIKSNTSHGLSMLYQKLNAIYGKEYRFEIGTDRRKNTLFLICIPVSDSYKTEGI